MSDLIERTRLAAQILRDIGGQSAMAATVDEAADALEAARAERDATRYRWLREWLDPKAVAALRAYHQADMDGVMVTVSREAIEHVLPYLARVLEEGE